MFVVAAPDPAFFAFAVVAAAVRALNNARRSGSALFVREAVDIFDAAAEKAQDKQQSQRSRENAKPHLD